MVGLLKEIREFFWPLLEGDPSRTEPYKEEECNYSNDEIDSLLALVKDYQTSEDNRRKEVESKASIFIGTFAVATTIMLSLAKDFISSVVSVIDYINIAIVVITIIYLCRAISFSIRCLSRKNYKTFGFPKYLLSNEKAVVKKKKALLEIVNDVRLNRDVINEKVDYMVMAQLYFNRAVLCVGILTVLLLVETLIPGI